MSRPLAAALFLAFLGAAATPALRCGDAYTVVRGDTLYGIARRCRGNVALIAGANRLADPRRIEIGQRLVLPRAGPRAHWQRAPGAPPARGGPGYRMARGDTLYSLARWARVSLGALTAANPGIDPRKIEIDDLVRLPAGAADPALARQRERGREGPVLRERPPRRSAAERRPDREPEPEPEGM